MPGWPVWPQQYLPLFNVTYSSGPDEPSFRLVMWNLILYRFLCNFCRQKESENDMWVRRWMWGDMVSSTQEIVSNYHISYNVILPSQVCLIVPLFCSLKFVVSWRIFSPFTPKKMGLFQFSTLFLCCFHELVWELRNKVNSWAQIPFLI